MSAFVLVAHSGYEDDVAAFRAVLDARGRSVQVVDRGAGEQLPAAVDGIRALVVCGPRDADALDAADRAALAELITACAGGEVPVCGVGGGADCVAAALGAATGQEQVLSGWVSACPTEAAADDEVCKSLVTGSRWWCDVHARCDAPPDTAVLACDPEGRLLCFGAERVHGLRFHVAAPADAEQAPGEDFRGAWSAALVGRWVDGVVGRTEEEAPWGRRGPSPVPRPGLVLHPAPES